MFTTHHNGNIVKKLSHYYKCYKILGFKYRRLKKFLRKFNRIPSYDDDDDDDDNDDDSDDVHSAPKIITVYSVDANAYTISIN